MVECEVRPPAAVPLGFGTVSQFGATVNVGGHKGRIRSRWFVHSEQPKKKATPDYLS